MVTQQRCTGTITYSRAAFTSRPSLSLTTRGRQRHSPDARSLNILVQMPPSAVHKLPQRACNVGAVATQLQDRTAAPPHAGPHHPRGPRPTLRTHARRNREVVKSLVTTAERLGYRVLVVTVDAPFIGNREADARNRFHLPLGLSLGNAHHVPGGTPAMAAAVAAPEATAATAPREGAAAAAAEEGSTLASLFTSDIDASLTWDFIEWLQTVTCLPIVVKVPPPNKKRLPFCAVAVLLCARSQPRANNAQMGI